MAVKIKLTRLGKIRDMDREALTALLGGAAVTLTLSWA